MTEVFMHSLVSNLMIGLSLAAILSLSAWRLGTLSVDGWIAATLVGGITYGLGGLPAAILLVAFFGTSSLLSMIFMGRKGEVIGNFAKGGRRDWAQVAANGGTAVLALIGYAAGWISQPIAWIAFAAGLATVTADTWATELGILSAGKPILVTTCQKVPQGTSGGVSLLGSASALAGSLLIALAAWLLGIITLGLVPLLALAGILGSFVDSTLGASIQAIYYCPKCRKETERFPVHSCGTPTHLHRGWRWMDNDWVNFLSSLFAAVLCAVMFTWLL